MTIKEIKAQFAIILKTQLIDQIDPLKLSKNHPNLPNISNIVLIPRGIELNDDHIDALNKGQVIDVNCDINGTYSRSSADNNITNPNKGFILSVTSLKLKIENDQLIIKACDCFVSNR